MTQKEKQHIYYLKNKSLFQRNSKEWYQKNREAVLARQKQQYRILQEVRVANRLLISARHRAKKASLPFNLSLGDLKIPKRCPMLGHIFELGNDSSGPWSPTIDRIIPDKGYVKGNIQIISLKANCIKGFASLKNLECCAEKQKTALSNLKKVIRFLKKNNT